MEIEQNMVTNGDKMKKEPAIAAIAAIGTRQSDGKEQQCINNQEPILLVDTTSNHINFKQPCCCLLWMQCLPIQRQCMMLWLLACCCDNDHHDMVGTPLLVVLVVQLAKNDMHPGHVSTIITHSTARTQDTSTLDDTHMFGTQTEDVALPAEASTHDDSETTM
eukprot:jgi/Psemu1/27343/gm1.27343_g